MDRLGGERKQGIYEVNLFNITFPHMSFAYAYSLVVCCDHIFIVRNGIYISSIFLCFDLFAI